MKINTFKSNKSIFSVFLVCLFLFQIQTTEAQSRRKKKEKAAAEALAAKAKKTEKKTIEELVKQSKKIEGLFTIYQDTVNGSVQMLISEDQIGKEFIYFNQTADGTSDTGRFRGAYGNSIVFKIEKYFDKIEFVTQNTSFYFDPNNPISKSQDANLSNGNMASEKVLAHDEAKKLYLISANDLFLKETLTQIKPSKFPTSSPFAFTLGSLDKDKTKINAIRNYPENTDIAVEYVYSNASVINNGTNAISDGRNVSIKVYHSLIAMPENDFEIRFDDPRVGYFTTQVDNQTSTSSTPYRDLIHRWNLIKKDPNAVISEPVTPITWWIENTTPLEWRETITEGVLEWNKAFEKAGFKNAMVVKIQPDDATWDAGDIRYNVLRWASSPNPGFGGYGPSFVNPKTGEIMGADIMLEYLHFTNRVLYDKVFDLSATSAPENNLAFLKDNHKLCSLGHVMHENTMFGQSFLAANAASDLEMVRMKKESMIALIMHEVGHTLGLNHNMKASHIFSPEQLNDAEFIKGKALTGSVMDYADININLDRTKQGQYYDTSVGPYDLWAIEFGYTPFTSETEKNTLLNKSTQPELIFGNDADDMRAPGKAIDPRVMVGDLSNDPIRYSVDRFKLVDKMMLDAKSKFTKTGESYHELRRIYYLLNNQKRVASGVISRFIGGVYVDRAMAGQANATKPFTPVNLKDQKRAMDALETYVFAPNAFDAPNDLYNFLAIQRRGYNFFNGPEDPKIHAQVLSYQESILDHILHYNTLQRIVDSELYGNEYKLSTFMTDLNNAIFKADAYSNINTFRQNLQAEYTNRLITIIKNDPKNRNSNVVKSMALYNLKSIRKMMAASTNVDIATKAHKEYLVTLIDNNLKEIK
ncbi:MULTISPECIES: zinc-dependent metalloprotease [Flavobacterium]|uniref:Zinc-dependent metalloprotease n=1 Tax=Flavobacterium jumunjinense TaxID=998845 RepID=A0ABV5GLE7_9FLAO|nr:MULTISPECIES: zinc-dependent metalloprotease [Flavobacterium]